MIYLVVGVDRRTLAPWHRSISERDARGARRLARARARASGVELVVAAVIGPGGGVELDAAAEAAAAA